MRWEVAHVAQPAPGTRFVALHNDFGGADLFKMHKRSPTTVIHANGTQSSWAYIQENYVLWTPLPEGSTLFYEDNNAD